MQALCPMVVTNASHKGHRCAICSISGGGLIQCNLKAGTHRKADQGHKKGVPKAKGDLHGSQHIQKALPLCLIECLIAQLLDNMSNSCKCNL